MLKNYQSPIGHFNLVSETIRRCFVPIYKNKSKKMVKKIQKRRRDFANSTMLKMWCECTDSIRYETLRKKIIKFNS